MMREFSYDAATGKLWLCDKAVEITSWEFEDRDYDKAAGMLAEELAAEHGWSTYNLVGFIPEDELPVT